MSSKNELKDVILFALDQTSRIAKLYSQREFDNAGLDITVDQWVLLKIIEENAALSQNELANKAAKDPASITRILDILARKVLIEREAVEGNRRQYQIKLTEKGRALIKQHMQMVNEHRERSVKGLTEKELEVLKNLLQRIQKNMT